MTIFVLFCFVKLSARNWTNLPASIKENSNLKDFLGYIQLQNDSFKHQDQQLQNEINQTVQMIQVSLFTHFLCNTIGGSN